VEAGSPLEAAALGGSVETLVVRPSTFLDGTQHAAGEGVVWVAGPTRVPVRLEGWIRTSEHAFLVHGLRATLASYTTAAAGWPQIVAAPAVEPDGGGAVATRDGVPVWTPPSKVSVARVHSGQGVRDVRSQISERGPSASQPVP